MSFGNVVRANRFDVPILFLIFNRVEQTRIVFEEIRKRQPKKLFIAADGPRATVKGESLQCSLTKEAVLNGIDWDCEVKTLFRDKNLGCGKAVSSAIDWFFDHVEEGIILEDDCVPDPSFFPFCGELLEKYRDNEQVMHISANNLQQGIIRGNESYYFSRLVHIWGWATWRRAWKKYDFTLNRYCNYPKDDVHPRFQNWIKQIKEGILDTWDVQWSMSVWWNKGIAIIPETNLVKNIGYGDKNATHTKFTPPKWLRRMRYGHINKIVHPERIQINKEADDFTLRTVYHESSAKKLAKKLLGRI
jgi:hypothetical protein